MLKTKKDFLLRKMGQEYMIVAVGAASESFNGFIRTNETGAFYWRELEKGTTEDALVTQMLSRFEDLDETTARADLREYLDQMSVTIENI